MLWVKINAPLEKKLRKSKDPVCALVVAEIEAARAKEAAKSAEAREGGHVTWVWIIQEFRKHLGDSLAVPPTPSSAWVATQVQRVRRLGLNEQQIYEVCKAAAMGGLGYKPAAFALERLLARGPELLTYYDRHAKRDLGREGGGAAPKDGGEAGAAAGSLRSAPGVRVSRGPGERDSDGFFGLADPRVKTGRDF